FAAAAIAGVISADDAMRAVAARGRAMAQCAAATPSGMVALVGGQPDEVLAAIGAAGAQAANFNGPGQIVAGGTVEALARLAGAPPRRTRLIPLDVAGAFHTPLMAPAEHRLRAALAQAKIHDPAVPFISNRDGFAMTNGHLILEAIIGQVTKPVRWDLVLERCAAHGIDHHLELAPAGVLTGLAKRALKGVTLEQAAAPQAAPPPGAGQPTEPDLAAADGAAPGGLRARTAGRA
ncbi:MAG: ACP S-malonyltransferase, partial [Bifidobacteriaceae bacterium]|nr:ACP S-malonyltransferase [Bifidobacteriaceae bacterium]